MAIKIGNRELIHVKLEIPRADVKVALDLASDVVGFEAYIPRTYCDGEQRKIEIIVISKEQIRIAAERHLQFPNLRDSQSDTEAASPKTLRRAAVVCWDLAHNPAGRALVLYEILSQEYEHVDLIGPLFPRFGDDVWEPIRNMGLNLVTKCITDFNGLVEFGDEVSRTTYGIVWICKPRLPGIVIGLQIAEASKCQVVLDIDDYEMSFFKNKVDQRLTQDLFKDLKEGRIHPADFDATAFAHSLIDSFKLKTVSNVSLQRAYGGELIPHARVASVFNSDNFDKAEERLKAGIKPNSTVVGFVGTVRKHKGVLEIAEAVGKLASDNLQFFVAGSFENEAIKEDISSLSNGRAVFGGSVEFSDLPRVLSCCNIICLPQDINSETSVFQLPAKLVDGIALGLTVIVNDLPAYDNLKIHPSLMIRGVGESLEGAIQRALLNDATKDDIRTNFLENFSVESLAVRATSYFSSISANESVEDVDLLFEKIFDRPLRTSLFRFVDDKVTKSSRDLVVLWKQVDSSLFGRRVDMVSKYLKIRGAYDRVFILDAPISAWDFKHIQEKSLSPGLTNARMIHDVVVQKFFGKETDPGVFGKSFITSERSEAILGRRLSKRSELKREIFSYLRENNVQEGAHLLVYPIAPHLRDVVGSWRFSKVIIDLVDDERDFATTDEGKKVKHEGYVEALCLADHVFTNNENMKSRFASLSTKPIHVIANGVERINKGSISPLRLEGVSNSVAVVGYVGNLRDRIDSDLLVKIADTCSNIHILLVGPTGGNRDIERLRFHPRITMTGARNYEETKRIAAGFDIGIIPHIRSSLTDSMNPLKFYLYRELNIPIVTTPIKNIESVDSDIYMSDGSHESFAEQVQLACSSLRRNRPFWAKRSRESLWMKRVDKMINILKSSEL